MYDKLMIVAHPDDETIFGGGTLLKEENVWKVVCVTNGDNRIRAKEFAKAMNYACANFEIWSYKDIWKGDFDRDQLAEDLEMVILEREYSTIVTHNLAGEYGHTQHKAISEIMHGLVGPRLRTFEQSDHILDLETLSKKLEMLKYYSSQKLERYKAYIVYEKLIF